MLLLSVGFIAIGVGIFSYWDSINKIIQQLFTHILSKYCIEIHHTKYIINYPIGVNWYKIIVPRKRFPFILHSVVDVAGNDITQNIIPFMGPGHDFHGMKITPKLIGYKELTFTFGLPEIKITFDENDIINVD
jgi:hypothetical protein